MFYRRVDLVLKNCLISSVYIITMIGSFSSSDYSAVGIDVFKTILGSFKYLTRTIMSSELWNTLSMYCFRFSLDFLYWYLASLCSDVVPKTAPKFYTSSLKFLIDDVYAGQLKLLPLPPRPWWPPLLVQPPRPRPRPPLLEFDSLVSKARLIVASLPTPPLVPAAGEAVSFSRDIVFYSFLIFSSWILFNINSYPYSAWDIRPISFCLHSGFDSFFSYLHVGLDLFLVWPNLNHISNNLTSLYTKYFMPGQYKCWQIIPSVQNSHGWSRYVWYHFITFFGVYVEYLFYLFTL